VDVRRIPEPEGDRGGIEHVGRIVARAVLPATKLRSCASCGGRFGGRDLHPVGGDHPMFFEGDELCRECAMRHSVL
jgi:hypothetical protein